MDVLEHLAELRSAGVTRVSFHPPIPGERIGPIASVTFAPETASPVDHQHEPMTTTVKSARRSVGGLVPRVANNP